MEKKSFIINELNSILENINLYCDKEKYKILFTVNNGFIKADLYLDISNAKPNDIDLLPPYFYENQELTLDMCRYKALFTTPKGKFPLISSNDVLALKNVTFFSSGKTFNLPCFLLFVDKIIGVNIVSSDFTI